MNSGCKRPLPDKLSQWIRMAVEDAKTLAATPGFKLDMHYFYREEDNGVCHVCLGGAALVVSCNISAHDKARFNALFIGTDIGRAVNVLDLVRLGNLNAARDQWALVKGRKRPSPIWSFHSFHGNNFKPYLIDDNFWAQIERAAQALEDIGE